jgi:hypothetical protein
MDSKHLLLDANARYRNYLDRQNIAASKLANIMKDLDMTVQQYNTCVSILFVGYSTYGLCFSLCLD